MFDGSKRKNGSKCSQENGNAGREPSYDHAAARLAKNYVLVPHFILCRIGILKDVPSNDFLPNFSFL